MIRFKNRIEAGQKLAVALSKYKGEDVVVFALPRGGVPLGVEIARDLNLPLELIIVRKIGHPMTPEYAVCAIAEDGDRLCNEKEIVSLDAEWLKTSSDLERKEAERRRVTYLGKKEPAIIDNKTIILVDDGVATGLSIRLAIKELRHGNPAKIIVAIPIIPKDALGALKEEADELVFLDAPTFYLGGISAYYDDFPQVSDDMVINLLRSINKDSSKIDQSSQ